MSAQLDILNSLLATPGDTPVDYNEVMALDSRRPTFIFPLILLLRHPHPELDPSRVSELIQRIALALPQRARLKPLLDPEGTGRYDNFYPAIETPQPSTLDTIDTFLDTYGNIDKEEEELLNRLIFNPVADYSATLEKETEKAPARDEQDLLLDTFLDNSPYAHTANETAPAIQESPRPLPREKRHHNQTNNTYTPPEGSLLSESLAKIFIKQHNYSRAYEIISTLNLNFPEKSIYFADQLRFLRKLMINEEAKKRKLKK